MKKDPFFKSQYIETKQHREAFHWKVSLLVMSLFLICSSFMYFQTADASQKESTITKEKIRVAVVEYPNFISMDGDGKVSGYAYDYLEKIASYNHWTLEYKKMSLQEAIKQLASGEVDILPGNQKTKERKKKFAFSSMDMGIGNSILCTTPDNTVYAYNDFKNYNGMHIGVLKGSVRTQQLKNFMRKYDVNIFYKEYNTDKDSKNALNAGEIDAVLMSSIRFEEDYKILAKLQKSPLYFQLSKNKLKTKMQLDWAMQLIEKNQPYYKAELYNKYYKKLMSKTMLTKKEMDYIQSVKTLTVAVDSDMKPLQYYDKKEQKFKGVIIEMYNRIGQNIGVEFRYVKRGSQQELLRNIQKGKVQIIGSIPKDEEIGDKLGVYLTDINFSSAFNIIANKSVLNYMNNKNRVILMDNYPFYKDYLKKRKYTNIKYSKSFQNCVEQVNNGKADMTIIPTYVAERICNHAYYRDLQMYMIENSKEKFCMGVSKKEDKMLVTILNKGIGSISNKNIKMITLKNLAKNNDSTTMRDVFAKYYTTILLILIVCFMISVVALIIFIVNRQRINKSLQVAIEKANKANEAKGVFLSRMSHDMRTPMNAIIGFSEIGQQECSKSELVEYLKNINDSGKYLLGLINDVLDMSKIETGKIDLVLEPYQITTLIDVIKNILGPRVQKKNIDFRVDTTEMTANTLYLDCQRMEQIFINLLGNAVKFTPEGGKIDFIIRTLNERHGLAAMEFIVQDNGRGMSEEFQQEKMYHSFEQESNKHIKNEEGTGLGLAITKNLIEKMGGNILCESKLGEGTKFTILLVAKISTEIQEEKKETAKEIELKDLSGKRLLLCEDHPMNVELMKRILKSKNIICEHAENGKIGVDMFADSSAGYYDAIIMDIRMPIMDGIEATKQIRRLSRKDAATIPIIAMTANAFQQDIEETKDAGMTEYVSKPINMQEFFRVLCRYI